MEEETFLKKLDAWSYEHDEAAMSIAFVLFLGVVAGITIVIVQVINNWGALWHAILDRSVEMDTLIVAASLLISTLVVCLTILGHHRQTIRAGHQRYLAETDRMIATGKK